MHTFRAFSVIVAVAVSYSPAKATPVSARQDALTTCGGSILTAVANYGNPTPFCSSYLGIITSLNDTVTEYKTTTIYLNRTTTFATGTQVITASSRPSNVTLTGSPSIVTETVYVTERESLMSTQTDSYHRSKKPDRP